MRWKSDKKTREKVTGKIDRQVSAYVCAHGCVLQPDCARCQSALLRLDIKKLCANDSLAADQALAVHYGIASCPTGVPKSSH